MLTPKQTHSLVMGHLERCADDHLEQADSAAVARDIWRHYHRRVSPSIVALVQHEYALIDITERLVAVINKIRQATMDYSECP